MVENADLSEASLSLGHGYDHAFGGGGGVKQEAASTFIRLNTVDMKPTASCCSEVWARKEAFKAKIGAFKIKYDCPLHS